MPSFTYLNIVMLVIPSLLSLHFIDDNNRLDESEDEEEEELELD